MSFIPVLSPRSVTLFGGLITTTLAAFAQGVGNDHSVATGSFLLGGAGLIAAISAFTKDFWNDRQKQRDHEAAMLRIKLRNCRTCNSLHELHSWARSARLSVPSLPPVPEFRYEQEEGSSGSAWGFDSENTHA
jgi:hypothetical protein